MKSEESKPVQLELIFMWYEIMAGWRAGIMGNEALGDLRFCIKKVCSAASKHHQQLNQFIPSINHNKHPLHTPHTLHILSTIPNRKLLDIQYAVHFHSYPCSRNRSCCISSPKRPPTGRGDRRNQPMAQRHSGTSLFCFMLSNHF